jgi:membrane fusion protein, multidrug efflux system
MIHSCKNKAEGIMEMKRVFLMVVGFWGILNLAACSNHPVTGKKEESGSVVKVKVMSAVKRQGDEWFQASGSVRSLIQTPLSSKIMGTILEIRVKEGDPVKTGQLLAVIDARDVDGMVSKSEAGLQEATMAREEVEMGMQAAQANLDLANATLKRYQELMAKKSVSLQEFDEVQSRQRAAVAQMDGLQARKKQVTAKIEQARSDVGSAVALKSYAEIRSPLNGVVMQKRVEPGSLAVPGMPLLVVEETGRFRLEVSVEESRIQAIKQGDHVQVKVAAAATLPFAGTVGEIQPVADPLSRTYLVKVNLPSHPSLRSGMYGEASFKRGLQMGMWIPSKAVLHQGQLEGIFVVDADKFARLRLVKLGAGNENEVEVLAGLDSGDQLVVEGLENLKDGNLVEVVR